MVSPTVILGDRSERSGKETRDGEETQTNVMTSSSCSISFIRRRRRRRRCLSG